MTKASTLGSFGSGVVSVSVDLVGRFGVLAAAVGVVRTLIVEDIVKSGLL